MIVKKLSVSILILSSFTLASCDLFSSSSSEEKEGSSDFDFGNNGNQNSSPSDNTSSGGSSGNKTPNLDDKSLYESLKNIEVIELDYRGLVSDSAFDNEISIPIDNITPTYDVYVNLDNQQDYEFFSVETNPNSINIKALDSCRFTHLNFEITYKGLSTIIDTFETNLVSNTTGFSYIQNFDSSITKLGENQIESNTYAEVSANDPSTTGTDFNRFNSEQQKYDLVIPSKVKIDGVIKEVGSYQTYTQTKGKYFYFRNLFVPETIFTFRESSLIYHVSNGFVHFSQSKKGFLYFYVNSLVEKIGNSESGVSYFLYEGTSRFFAGPEYYYFPYTKRALSSSLTWNSEVTYSSWDWKNDYINYRYNHDSYLIKRQEFFNNNTCFRV